MTSNCHICGAILADKGSLSDHIRYVHPMQKWACPVAQCVAAGSDEKRQTYKNAITTLNHYIRVHNDFKCPIPSCFMFDKNLSTADLLASRLTAVARHTNREHYSECVDFLQKTYEENGTTRAFVRTRKRKTQQRKSDDVEEESEHAIEHEEDEKTILKKPKKTDDDNYFFVL